MITDTDNCVDLRFICRIHSHLGEMVVVLALLFPDGPLSVKSFDPRQAKPHQPMIMGILNVTPDSFSDGGLYVDLDAALQQVEHMLEAGAQIIDVGGESTRPGALPVTSEQELGRVIPVVEAIAARFDCWISLDTSSAQVITEGAKAGAHIINDVRALQQEGALEAAVNSGLPVCIMHMQGTPQTMQNEPSYQDVTKEVGSFLLQRADACITAGIRPEHIMVDPGFGFGKTLDHNYQLLSGLEQLKKLGFPILTGLSRKKMIKQVISDDASLEQLDEASAAAAAVCIKHGASIVRVHNVAATSAALKTLNLN